MKHLKKFSNDLKKANLSKDMKKQKQSGKVSSKPIRKVTTGDKSLAPKPKVGRYTEPSSKKLSSEQFLAKSKSKLTHIKEFNQF